MINLSLCASKYFFQPRMGQFTQNFQPDSLHWFTSTERQINHLALKINTESGSRQYHKTFRGESPDHVSLGGLCLTEIAWFYSNSVSLLHFLHVLMNLKTKAFQDPQLCQNNWCYNRTLTISEQPTAYSIALMLI